MISNTAVTWLREKLEDYCMHRYGDHYNADVRIIIETLLSGIKQEDDEYLKSIQFKKHCKLLLIDARFVVAFYETIRNKK